MTPREIFACAPFVDKLQGEDLATELAIATAAAALSAGAKDSDQYVRALQADLTDFEPI